MLHPLGSRPAARHVVTSERFYPTRPGRHTDATYLTAAPSLRSALRACAIRPCAARASPICYALVLAPGPFDTTTKYLVQTYPRDWLDRLGLPTSASLHLLDADLATVNPLADKVIRVDEAAPWLAHLEFQSTYDATMGQRLAEYNLLLYGRHGLPARSLLVLLRPGADGPALGGMHTVGLPGEVPEFVFRYRVTRLWRQSAEALLDGPLGTLPLAPLADVETEALPDLLRQLEERLDREAAPAEATALKIVTFTLLGLRLPRELARALMPGVRTMRDSSTYQMILDEGRAEGEARGEARGRAEEARRMLLLFGAPRLGQPDAATLAVLAAIGEPERLEQLGQRLHAAESWTELLATP